MSRTNKSALALILLSTILALFLQRTPLTMTTTPPTSSKPWADTPCALIPTPQYLTNKTDIFTTGATHMCHIHNAILRGFNSIYNQAPQVKSEDKAAFVGYALTWFHFVKSHHDDEEASLFPRVADVLRVKDEAIWGPTHAEHESFLAGLGEYARYLEGLNNPQDFDGETLTQIMSSFQQPFAHHFHAEISTIASFADLPSAPAQGSDEEAAAAAVFKTWGKKTVMKAGTLDVVPFFLLNLDKTYEEGKWANWPPMPAPVRWGLVNVAASWNWAWWKFASCDGAGMPRELHALGE